MSSMTTVSFTLCQPGWKCTRPWVQTSALPTCWDSRVGRPDHMASHPHLTLVWSTWPWHADNCTWHECRYKSYTTHHLNSVWTTSQYSWIFTILFIYLRKCFFLVICQVCLTKLFLSNICFLKRSCFNTSYLFYRIHSFGSVQILRWRLEGPLPRWKENH